MSLVETLKIIVLGIVEGFTEWLPISSTGHMILVDEIIRLNQPEAFKEVFRVVIQLGAILAVVIMYFNRLNPFSRQKTSRQRDATWALWIKIVVACVPAAVLGLLLDDWMEAHLFNAYVVAAMLIIYGVLFILVENSRRYANSDLQKVGQIPIQTAFYIGMFQVLSLVPGTSRSGATILGAMIKAGEILPGRQFLHRPADFLHRVRHAHRLPGVRVLHQVPDELRAQERFQVLRLLPDYSGRDCAGVLWDNGVGRLNENFIQQSPAGCASGPLHSITTSPRKR